MIDVSSYIEMILRKKNWTRTRLCEELNRIEAQLGEKRTTIPNVTQYLTGVWAFRPKILAKWEIALGLKKGTLMNMVMPPLTKEGKEELKETLERLKKVC